MKAELYFLTASDGTKLTKSYHRDENGRLAKQSYPHVFNFNSTNITIDSLDDFYESLLKKSDANYCLLKGTLNRNLENESRAGSTDPYSPTSWICLDIDGFDLPP